MSSTITTTFTPPTSLAATNFSNLPFELIWAILEQCDDYLALHALRRTCKTFRWYIDNNPSFDKFLFRNRPLTNPAVTLDELDEIRTWGQIEQGLDDDSYYHPSLSEVNPHIKVHPILSRIGWDVEKHWHPDDDEDVDIVDAGLKMKDVPHILDECATCPPISFPPVSIFEADLESGGYYVPDSFDLDPDHPYHNNRHKQGYVLVRDVIHQLLSASDKLYQWHHVHAVEPIESTDFKTGSPRIIVTYNGLMVRFAFQSGFARCWG